MSKYWNAVVHGLTPYVPGEQPKIDNLIKLNTNENPYPPSPLALQAMQQEIGPGMRLYPDPNSDRLKQAIAKYYDVSAQQVFVGNGSDEVLAHAFLGLLKHDRPILFPDISYSFYPVYCGLYEIEYDTVPLADDFSIETDGYLQPNGGVIFPNPNAPTGCLLSLDRIEKIVAANGASVVVVDEAYIDFGGQSAIPLIAHYPNLLVVQTLSKSRSLAGLRVGFAIGHPDLIEALDRVKNSFNSYPLDRIAIAGATAALSDEKYFQSTCAAIIATRETLVGKLEGLGFSVLPSAANFILMRHPMHDATQMAASLRSKNIIVRHFLHARIAQFLRVTIGTEQQCEALVSALNAYLNDATNSHG
jgi:histidinol-phosphate aminotransferase